MAKNHKSKVKKSIPKPKKAGKTPKHKKSKSSSGGSRVSSAIGALGMATGGLIGGPTGASIGGSMGKSLGNWLSGRGAYRIKSNSLTGVPIFQGNGEIRLRRREFLLDISGTTAFTNTTYPINPGLIASFPWLSAVAANFEQYEFQGLAFEYKSTSAVALNSTNTALGVVVMATNYDTLDPAFTSKQQMEAYQYADSIAPSQSMIHFVECAPRQTTIENLYLRFGAVPSGADQRFYDLGNFELATSGMQAASVIGELWVTYDVILRKPKLPTPLGGNLQYAHIVENPASSANASTSSFLGTTGGKLRSDSTLATVATKTTFSLPTVGFWLVTAVLTGSVTVAPTLTPGSNITAQVIQQGSTISAEYAVSASNAMAVCVYSVTAAGTGAANLITIGGCTNLATGTADVFIAQISSGVTVADNFISKAPVFTGSMVQHMMHRIARLEKSRSLSLVVESDDDDFKDF